MNKSIENWLFIALLTGFLFIASIVVTLQLIQMSVIELITNKDCIWLGIFGLLGNIVLAVFFLSEELERIMENKDVK